MALLDLSSVSSTFTGLLAERLKVLDPTLTVPNELNVSAAAPDVVTGKYGLSFYLYHVREDAHTKSQDWQTDDDAPLRYKPMGLTLYYVLCARSNITDPGDRALAEQRLMGLAIKTLHDFPLINDATDMLTGSGIKKVLPLGLRGNGNIFRTLMMPTQAAEAGQYWQSGSQALRLASFYEVSATLIEPEIVKSRRTRVLSVGVQTLVRGQPLILSTQNTVTYHIPGDPSLRTIDISPAEAAYGDTVEFIGADLKGDTTTVLLIHPDFSAPVEVDANWKLKTNGETLFVVVRNIADAQAILPGIYSVMVKTTARFTLPDGSTRDIENYSNQATLAIAPKVIALTILPGNIFQLQVEGFMPRHLQGDDLQLFIGAAQLDRTSVDPPPPSQFVTRADDPAIPPPLPPSADDDKIRLSLPPGFIAGELIPIRLIVRGVEAAPLWGVAP